jgi:hypothetical protein
MGLGYEEDQKNDWIVCGICGVSYPITQKEPHCTINGISEHCSSCMSVDCGHNCEYLNEDNSCPCGICIVKAMCQYFCDEWYEWNHKQHYEWNHKQHDADNGV